MGLLNPLLLLLAAAAAVPLLLHLLQRHQGPRVIFPALRYLRRAEKESARRIRLRQILLMLLRIAAVLLIAFAAARPFVGFGGAGHSPTAVVIVLDNSMSTAAVEGERRVLDRLEARALETLEAAGPDDRFWLLRAAQPDDPALIGDAAVTALRVRETEPSAGTADIAAALARAAAILAAGAEGRAAEIHLLTDLQAASFDARLPADSSMLPVVLWHPGTEPPVNRAVADVQVGGGMAPISGQRTTVAIAVTGETGGERSAEAEPGDTVGDPVDVRLLVNGRLMAAAAASSGAVALLSLPAPETGVMTGSAEIDADALHADDRRYFAARVQPPPTVALSRAAPFIADALDVLAEAGRIRRASTNADVAILPAAEGATAPGPETALVALPPSTPTELAAANRRLNEAGIPWRYDAPAAGEARFAPDQPDPLLRGLADARIRQLYPLTRTTEGRTDSVLIRLADGSPWAVRGTRANGGAYVLLGSPLSEQASTVPTSALMLPLLDRLTGAWSLALPPRSDAAPGQEIALPAATTVVERPDGTRDSIAGATTYRFGAEPGIYRILEDDSIVAAYAVNPPAAESDLARLEEDDLEAYLPGWALHVTTSDGAWRRAVYRERLGTELWRPLLLLLLIILAAETLIAASGRGRTTRGSGRSDSADTAASDTNRASPARAAAAAAGADEG
ncbi:MAG TPA: BatA domain-containing protein [Longimicrobiales bacterium]|nr:BatA domain-containing protein [Longimicrobiales bacterium]